MRALAGSPGLASMEERPYRQGEVAGYWLVIAATGDPEVNRAVYEDGRRPGIWVNSADDPANCSFILPAVARQGPVTVAISTNGYSPALASWLKQHVVEQMGPELAELAELLAEARLAVEGSGKEHRRGRLAAELGLGHARPHPLGTPSRSKGAPRGVSIAVVGINHRTVPLPALEPMIVAPGDLHKALADLSSRSHLDEVVVLSTCMRTEVYALVNRFHGAMADIREFFSTWSGQPPEDFSGSLYSYFDEAAVNYLFRVSAGLDSASLGEPEILGQVRQAWEVAREENTCGPVLGGAFRHALLVGKRARAETAISRGTTSLSHAAQELAASRLGGLQGKQAMVIGLGEVGESAARAFASVPGALPVIVANRTRARAEQVAEAIGGRVATWAELPTVLRDCRRSGQLHIGRGRSPRLEASARAAVASRAERPMLLVDLAVPRDIDPEVANIPGVTLLNMDDISGFRGVQGGREACGGAGRRADNRRGGRPLRHSARCSGGRAACKHPL